MKRYPDCPFENSECRMCSLSSYEMDCHGNPAHALLYFRKARNLSQQQLADSAGVARSQIAKFELDLRDLSAAHAITVLRIARALDVTVEDLICGQF